MPSTSPMTLEIDFAGEIQAPGLGEQLVFGREADLVIDENPYLHRRLGQQLYSRGDICGCATSATPDLH
ncbi:MAG: hypothetical protein R2706_02915 [Acidimicrobiales bacterium]